MFYFVSVFSCVKGKLVEVNEKLTTNPELILQKVRLTLSIACLTVQ